MNYYLAIDIGASSGRHILAHLQDGKMVTEEIYRFSNGPQILPGTPGALGSQGNKRLMWDTERLFKEILNGLKRAKELNKIPVSVGVDTWGVDYVLLDESDTPLEGVYCYRDGRTKSAVPSAHRRIPFAELYAKTGIQYQSFNTVYQLYDDKRDGRLQKAKTFLMLPDYFHYLLTGVKRQEYTNATTTGMVNALTHAWDEEILDALGYDKKLFGALSQPGTAVGEFTDEVAAFVGYRAKVVLPATHDTASAVLAAPLEGQTPYISSGTWSLLGVEQTDAHTSEKARELNYSNEGSVNNTFRLQKNIMGLWMIQQVRHELDDKYDFSMLASLARLNRVSDVVDVNDEKFLAPSSMIEAINASVGKQLSVGGLAYCIFNSLAKSYAESLSALEELTNERYDTLNIIGGGSKNELLNELTAEYTGRKIVTGPTEGTAIGNFMMQMVGMGELSSVAEGRRIIKTSFDIREV
ncbi:MAG: rhamnulokinase [Clostridia bacterium]|nr:rhamnulokinase [Clostridia bacterium]